MKRKNVIRTTMLLALICALLLPVGPKADAVELDPGYISGTVSVGDLTVSSLSISAYGNGYSSSKSTSGNSYTLTVQGGDWNYNVSTTALIRTTSAYYPYTYLYFKSRSFPVGIGETVTNDYAVTPGTIRFKLNITGDPYSYWYVYGYANKSVSTGEQTNSYSYAHSSYVPAGEWDMPVVPNQGIRIYANVYVDGKAYWFSYIYRDVAEGQTVEIPINIQHTSPAYDYGTVQGRIELGNVEGLSRHGVSGGNGNGYAYTNPGDYSLTSRTGMYFFMADSYFDNYRTYLRWPYAGGDYWNNYITVEKGQTYTKDFIADTGTLTGQLNFTGTLNNDDLYYWYIYAYGSCDVYVPGSGWVRQDTCGGFAQTYKYGSEQDFTYRLFLQPGPWDPYTIYAYGNSYDKGYSEYFSLSINDYNYYYDGYSYDFGSSADITAGGNTVQDREYCTGTAVVRFRNTAGGLLSNPYVSGSANVYNESGKRERYISVSGYSYPPPSEAPEVEIHGLPGVYNLSARATTEDGSQVTFAQFTLNQECGVTVGRDIYGPEITIESPSSGLVTTDRVVTVSGTATDESGVALITVNGTPVDFQPTGNPEDPNEVAFSHDLLLDLGENTITVAAEDVEGNSSSNTRTVVVYLAAEVTVKPEAGNNKGNGTMTVFVRLSGGLTSTASLSPGDTVEITAEPAQSPYGAKYSSGEDKLVLKFHRTPELMSDNLYTVQGIFCTEADQCAYWMGSDTTRK